MEARQGAAVRIVRLEIDDPARGEQLFGPGVEVSGSVELVFQNMLPAPPEATLAGVTAHGLVLTFEPDQAQPSGLVVPWGQIAYLRFATAGVNRSGETMSERLCIKCNQPMRPRMLETVEVESCPGCGGLWLDQGEVRQLGRYFDPGIPGEPEQGAPSSPYRTPTPPVISTRSPLQQPCPACGGKLSEAAFESFVIESCVACEGIFLDPGELEQAMELVDASRAATVVALARSVATTGTIED